MQNEKGDVILTQGKFLDEEVVDILEEHGIDRVFVRSVITCEAAHGICAKCYGRDLARGHVVNPGEAIGVIAAQSIGEPGTQLTMRSFHIGGAASRATAENNIQVRVSGTVRLHNVKTVRHHKTGHLIATSRSGKLTVLDDRGRECERYKVLCGATILIENNAKVKTGQIVAEWDPYTHPIISEVNGHVDFVDMIEGITITKQTDSLTGLSSIVILNPDQRSKDIRPMIRLLDSNNKSVNIPGTKVPANYFLSPGAIVNLESGAAIGVGDVIARLPKEGFKTRDIAGGLPRVADLFEARRPKDAAILAEVSGIISYGKETKDKRRLVITSAEGDTYEELIPKWRSMTVFEGESVQKGEVLVDGQLDSHALLRLLGVTELARYIVNEVQDVYRLQGVKINDKHIEVIIRQMLRKVRVTNPGDSDMILDEVVDRYRMSKKNSKVDLDAGGLLIETENILLGITKASLSTDSFISAASFQETTRVLTEASVTGRYDPLKGLKENVIVGRLVPAGTGFSYHQQLQRKNQDNGMQMDLDMVSAELNETSTNFDFSNHGGGDNKSADSSDSAQD